MSLFLIRSPIAYFHYTLQQAIISLPGIPATVLAGFLVELPIFGRRGTLSVSTRELFYNSFLLHGHQYFFLVLTGVCILGSTTARNSNTLLGWNCVYSFANNIMYGALFAITPELFPTKARGTGNAIVGTANRIFGVLVCNVSQN